MQAHYLRFIYQGNSFHVSSEYCCTVSVPNLCMVARIRMPRSAQLFCDLKFLVVIINFRVPLDFYINVGLADVLSKFLTIFRPGSSG